MYPQKRKLMQQNDPIPFFQPVVLPAVLKEMHKALVNAANTAAARRAALAIVKEYHGFFAVADVRSDMCLLLNAAMGRADMETIVQEQHNLHFFYEFTLLFMDAVYILHGREQFGKLVEGERRSS